MQAGQLELPRHWESGDDKLVRLRAPDGFELGGIFYPALRPRRRQRVAVLHCGAGIPARRYRRFAHFLAEWGIPVLSYDYRGVGLSRPATLQGFAATMADWACDSAAAIGWLRERFPHDEVIGISHSIGALPLGGAANAAEQSSVVLIGPHTGYCGDYRALYRAPMTAIWHGLMPAVTRIVGYFPGTRLRLGEDLPAGVALQWAGRVDPELRPSGPGSEEARTRALLDRCAALERPALVVSISDDAFATPAGVGRLLSYFPRLVSPRPVVFGAAQARVARIGHFGFFRHVVGAVLWPRLLTELEARPA